MGKRRRKAPEKSEALVPKKPLTQEVRERIEAYVDESIEAHQLVLFDLTISPKWHICLTADTPEGATPGKGITIQQCTEVTRYLEALLDVDENVDPGYTLEVSSPGIDRPLTKWRHYEASIGRTVKIVLADAIEGQTTFEGELTSAQDQVITIDDQGTQHQFNFEQVAKGRLTFDFSGVTEG